MNKILSVLAIVFLLPLAASANPGAGGGPGPDDYHGRKVERLTKELNLTDEQKTQVEALFKEQHEKFKALHEETNTKLKTILTPEQMNKMEAMQKQHQEKWRHKKGMKEGMGKPE
jgi:Spy/CpxP family protein refolding chaperone